MDVNIDWLSWTFETDKQPVTIDDTWYLAEGIMHHENSSMAKKIFGGYGYEAGPGRPPYRVAVQRADHGLGVYGNSHTGTILYELSGTGAKALRGDKVELQFYTSIVSRITRVDVACDVRTATSPVDFCARLKTERFRSRSEITSDTGQTVYIGSPKSDRYARVYRYHPPHPRAQLLRVEFVFRRGMAEAAISDFIECGDARAFAARAGNTWGLDHPDWQPGVVTDERTSTPNLAKGRQDSVMWLYKQVAPAMRRLIADGSLDMGQFLAYVLDVNQDNPIDKITADRLHDTWD